jgi:hypothetical protein
MRIIRRTTAVLAAFAIAAIGIALAGETIGRWSGRWRDDLAQALHDIAAPTWPAWQSALLGSALAIAAIVLIAAEFTRPPKGTRIMHPVHNTHNGATHISGRAAIRAACKQVESLDGVVDVDATITKSEMTLTARLDDRADIEAVEASIRERLGHEFWINLGLADLSLNLLLTHHPKPPRVR